MDEVTKTMHGLSGESLMALSSTMGADKLMNNYDDVVAYIDGLNLDDKQLDELGNSIFILKSAQNNTTGGMHRKPPAKLIRRPMPTSVPIRSRQIRQRIPVCDNVTIQERNFRNSDDFISEIFRVTDCFDKDIGEFGARMGKLAKDVNFNDIPSIVRETNITKYFGPSGDQLNDPAIFLDELRAPRDVRNIDAILNLSYSDRRGGAETKCALNERNRMPLAIRMNSADLCEYDETRRLLLDMLPELDRSSSALIRTYAKNSMDYFDDSRQISKWITDNNKIDDRFRGPENYHVPLQISPELYEKYSYFF